MKREALFWHFPCYIGQGGPTSAIRQSGGYKLLGFFEDHSIELYSLTADPEEKNNLVKTDPKLAELAGANKSCRKPKLRTGQGWCAA